MLYILDKKTMKLRQLLKAHFDTNGPTKMLRHGKFNGVLEWLLTPALLKVYLEELNMCVEFANTKIVILDDVKSGKPQRVLTGHDEDGVPIYDMKLSTVSLDNEIIVTTKLTERTKFAPIVKLFSISLGPEMFDQQDVFRTECDTVVLTPPIYNTELAQPVKRMIITYSPDVPRDLAIKKLKKELKERDNGAEKPEFTVDKQTNVHAIKEHETAAKDLMENISEDELKQQIKEQETQYLDELITKVRECFLNPSQHLIPSKMPILLRLTKDSLVDNDKLLINSSDITVTLKKQSGG